MKRSNVTIIILIAAAIVIFIIWWFIRPSHPKEEGIPAGKVTVEPHRVHGAKYPPIHISPDFEPNEDKPYVPAEGPVKGNYTPSKTKFQIKPMKLDSSGNPINGAGADVFIDDFDNAGPLANASTTMEPSVASNDSVIFVTYNWGARYSTDRGNTWTDLDPTTIFPSGPQVDGAGNSISGSFCCDQVMQYAPSIHRFIWFMQFCGTGPGCGNGSNIIRIAAASSDDIISSGGTAWVYWDIVSTQVEATEKILDYPDMSVGQNSLYISIDAVGKGLVIMRLPLHEIQLGTGFTFWFTHPTDSQTAYGGHVCQNPGNEVYWAGHVNTSKMRIFSWKETETTYYWRDRDINSWTTGLSSNTPSGVNWLAGSNGFPGNAVLGITLKQNEIWFAWGANAGKGFKNAHIQVAKFRNTDYKLLEQMQIWNDDYAFAYPCFSTNTENEVGISLMWGGVTAEASHAAGFMGDFIVYCPRMSTSSNARNGDYVTIRRYNAKGNAFSVVGYSTHPNPTPPGGNYCDLHYFMMGRP